MLSLYAVLKAGSTGIAPDLWTLLAARKLFGGKICPTDENDYIYSADSIIYYIGSKKYPGIPQRLEGVPVKVIERTAFTGKDVMSVCIPEGTEVIE